MRFHKQTLLPELGESGQQRLAAGSVLVIGAGGLGCPALQYLAASGLGRIGLADFDVVELSNLHRQILYTEQDLGQPKAEVAARRLKAMNSALEIQVFQTRISTHNALDILVGFDVILDASDNFPTRYLIDDACRLLKKPLIYGSVYRFEGQMSVFHWPVKGISSSYRDLFPKPPQPGEVADCNEAGVLGVLPGIIGTMQAAEAIKLIAGIGTLMANRLFCYQILHHSTYTLDLVPRTDVQAPESAEDFREMNYDWFCNMQASDYQDIDGQTFDRIRAEIAPQILDVRNLQEWPKVTEFEHLRIPLAELEQNLHLIDPERPLVVFCQSGVRSVTALNLITERLPVKSVYHLKGGILKWKTRQ
ncbi:MAG: HesA/MoeB/ThiF family protein [Saprospiraceae bacterium]|nr:HesA/MoeB/ThiF family protein [Saprospiraceae bacterium]